MRRPLWLVLGAIAIGLMLLMLFAEPGLGGDGDRYAQLISLGILGTVIAAGILGSGARLGSTLRSLAVWALIILVLVAGYQYRYELQDIASRVTAGLVPGSPLTIAADGETVMLMKAGSGHFKALIDIDGAEIHTVVDTGATATVLTSADARAAGIDVGALNFNVPISTANGTARAARATVGAITVGSIVRRNMTVLIAEPAALAQSLLGMNFIGSLSGFDVRGDRMILHD
jgi:aspartyl protease family protein